MAETTNLWTKWKAIAHRAAVVQSNILLWLLYYIVVVPIAGFKRLFVQRSDSPQPLWRERPPAQEDRVVVAHRQF